MAACAQNEVRLPANLKLAEISNSAPPPIFTLLK